MRDAKWKTRVHAVVAERALDDGRVAHVGSDERDPFGEGVCVPGGEVVHHDHAVPSAQEDPRPCGTRCTPLLRHADVHRRASLARFLALPKRRLRSVAGRGDPRAMKTTRNLLCLIPVLSSLALPFLVACGGDTPAAADVRRTPGPSRSPTRSTPQRKSDQDVSVSQNIRDLCKIDDSERSPKFDFDSSQLSSSDRDILQQVAKCMTDGALKGKNIELIGRADPRGEQEYNMTLGSSRATAAHKYLDGLGIDDSRHERDLARRARRDRAR